jgi:flagellar biosynthetic protein FlhB
VSEHDDAQRSEEATPRKLEKGRERGQVAVSQELKSWAVLVAGSLGVLYLVPSMLRGVGRLGLPFLEQPDAIRIHAESVQAAMLGLVVDAGLAVAPLVGLILVLVLGVGFAQAGLIWAPEKIQPELNRISPSKGARRLLSGKGLVEFGKGLIKLAVVGAAAVALSLPVLRQVELLPSMALAGSLDRLEAVAVRLIVGAAGLMTFIAALDFLFQRWSFLKDMRMTKQEVRDEHKQSEGDPQIKARIRKLRHERAQRRMMAAVPKADVVITNPTHFAVALVYDMKAMTAPRVVAKGADFVAAKIREIAAAHDVPVVENPPLARALYASVELDEEIPAQHYRAVAEVIGYVMRLKGKLPNQ